MKYHTIKVEIKNVLLLWEQVKAQEKFFFYNPYEKKMILAWERNCRIEDCIDEKVPFFYTIRFNEEKVEKEWENYCTEKIVFNYILYSDKDGTFLIYRDKKPKLIESDHAIIRHIYNMEKGNYHSWEKLYTNIKNEIKEGKVKKVVASRKVVVHSTKKFDIVSIILNLLNSNKESFVFAYEKNKKTFLGASPEILVQKTESIIKSYAIAGTMPKKKHIERGKWLLDDLKNNEEHKIVVDYIAGIMKKNAEEIYISRTTLLELKNLYHLKTEVMAKNLNLSLVDWAKLLHPTPAMCGVPKEKAMGIINDYEEHDRGLFAAPIGVIDEKGDGVFIVGIRSALIEGNTLYAYAGCGIVEQSDCREEYEEINNKLRTILEAL
ncbi:isochorismate synthase [Dorea formicigenerans]|uniref:isochorismate synthase n=1 Tax=Dorea formicigenerans TaxID=39486 RepID=A0A564TWS3_9FIRM|nr:isochorismate synthase [Dorea formicigenerans]VUX11665.1 Salicylate biosynthesis isochorismate synthase [Dorea formicigenerans]